MVTLFHSNIEKLNPYKSVMLRAFEKCIPVNLHIELTRLCNIKCAFCYNQNEAIFLDTGIIKKVLDEACTLGSLYLGLTGGEPLLHPDFFEIAAYSKKSGYLLIIQTNGILIDEHSAIKIAALNPAVVDISIHGTSDNTHDLITRSKGSFIKAITAIKTLKSLGCPVRIKTPVTRINQDELEQINELAQNLNCPITFDPFISPTLSGDKEPLHLKPDFDKLADYFEYTILDNEGDMINLMPKKISDPVCGMGRNSIAITAEGIIQPCMRVRIPLGNILKNTLADTWKYSETLKEIRKISRVSMKKCKECTLINYCFLCPGLIIINNNNLRDPYPEACKHASLRYQRYKKEQK